MIFKFRMQNIWNWLEIFFFSHFENQSVLRRQQWNREALQRLIFRIPSSRFFVFLASSLLFRVPDHLLNSFELLLITPPDSFVFLAAPSLSLFNSSKKQRAQVKANSHWINDIQNNARNSNNRHGFFNVSCWYKISL